MITRNVLIVEDDLSLNPILTQVFHSIDPLLNVDWVTSAEEGLERIRTTPYTMVVADYSLAGNGTGLDLWDYCKDDIRKIPFVVVSSIALDRYFRLVGNRVSPPFLAKPIYIGEAKQIFKAALDYSTR